MRKLIFLLALIGCSDDNKDTPDAAIAAPAALSCDTYCTKMAADCTGANGQYGGADAADALAHCMGTCKAFTPGTLQDDGGQATLGCHINHADNAMKTGMPQVHCIHAGPAGNQVDQTAGVCGDACTNFCQIEIATCGTKPANTLGQYTDMADCMTACGAFDKTAKYTVDTTTFPSKNPTGDNLACRLYHATNAAVSTAQAMIHCAHTAVMSTVCK